MPIEKGRRNHADHTQLLRSGNAGGRYDLLQKKGSAVLGGGCWLNMGHTTLTRAIDLSALLSHAVEEREDRFVIGAMTTLRAFETHPGLNAFFHGAPGRAVESIVGVQFRNCATVGGSVCGRFGFSDVLTLLLTLDCEVELFHAGVMPLAEFVERKEKDILKAVILHKTTRRVAIRSVRRNANDFPVLVCAVAERDGICRAAVGARPNKAKLVTAEVPAGGEADFAAHVTEGMTFLAPTCGAARNTAPICPGAAGPLSERTAGRECAMEVKLTLNGRPVTAEVAPDLLLLDFVRDHGCLSVKRGCETAGCGLCTVMLDRTPVLSCQTLAVRANGRSVTTLGGPSGGGEGVRHVPGRRGRRAVWVL